jgi:hypothetical protein
MTVSAPSPRRYMPWRAGSATVSSWTPRTPGIDSAAMRSAVRWASENTAPFRTTMPSLTSNCAAALLAHFCVRSSAVRRSAS